MTADDCSCNRFNLKAKDGGSPRPEDKEVGMPCEEQMASTLTTGTMTSHATLGPFLDPGRFQWRVGCYVPKKTTWFWGEKDDLSKSKCGCFLQDTKISAEGGSNGESMCSYAPMEVDARAVETSTESATEADKLQE